MDGRTGWWGGGEGRFEVRGGKYFRDVGCGFLGMGMEMRMRMGMGIYVGRLDGNWGVSVE